MSASIIQTTPDDKLEQLIVDAVINRIGKDDEHKREIIVSMPKGFRFIYATWLLEAEVNNGGFNQFFWNTSGKFSADALEGLREIGARKHERLLSKAIQLCEKERSVMKKFKNQGTLEAFSESYKHTKLNELDEEFYKLNDLESLRVKYIRAHPELFKSE